MNNTKKVNYMLIYKIVYLLHVFLAFNCFTYKLKILDITSWIVVLGGILLLSYRVFNYKKYKNCKYLGILVLFGISYGISCIVNMRYGITGNIKGGMWMMFQFFLLYCIDYTIDRNKIKNEFIGVSVTTILYTAICNFCGIMMMFLKIGGVHKFSDDTYTFYGFVWGRLWGCYTDPNHGALVAAIAILMAIYLIYTVKKWYLNVLLGITILLNYLYIVFSDSRSAKLCFSVSCFILVFLALEKLRKKKKRMLFSGIVAILAAFIVLTSFNTTKKIYNFYSTIRMEVEVDEGIDKVTVGREADIEEDYSNRRFDIWKSGLQIFAKNKFFGISFRNIVPYASEELPDTYIVNNDMGKFDSFHNVIIDTLVAQGIVGILLIIMMGIVYGLYSIRKLLGYNSFEKIESIFLFAMIVLLLSEAMFVSAIFYVNTPETVLFWMLLGYMVYFMEVDIKKSNEEG